ncbi:acetyl-CoA carboxylase carboxyltransferase subunit alpha [Natranaerovirga pectinivora]|uniref:Acetyl-coenzyme A carboxylase carboxyl transferase subunit beta n=1 Tax=Natranaerovirga pectinivora TaxID=682400 RepID=A0A4R3MFK5_9FIRM|nr:acetyl-CoA carboxylase, carboxyltransferase subunit beta [Natranaerovirga pectinivora]TCT12298.1 acetyl-CoA carboxylase carboxyltransferase subunit alpha [Natranaerovirga pectinivora]
MLKEMFKKTKYITLSEYHKQEVKTHKESTEAVDNEPNIPDGLWIKCKTCGSALYKEDVQKEIQVCKKCNYHFNVDAYTRISIIMDEGSFNEWDKDLITKNVLNFPNYESKITNLQNNTGINEAVVTGVGDINGIKTVIAVMDSRFMMGSMGAIVGEKITRAIENATAMKLPIIIFTASGGARMQEGIISLMQMAKTSAALARHNDEGLLYVSFLTNPTTGGVTASFAMLGDIILAEPEALIGFAGPRVIQQTIGQKLPEGFQKAEFLLEHGFVDKIVERKEIRSTLHQILLMHKEDSKC